MLVPIGAGTSLEVADAGAGPAVVLLNGWPVTAMHWRHIVPVLVRSGYRAITVEARGLGETSSGRGGHDKATLAREVIAVLDVLGVRRFAIIGHDWGGTIALLIAAAQRERVVAIAIEESVAPGLHIETDPDVEPFPDWHVPLFQAPEGVAERLLAGRHDTVVDAFLEASAGPGRLDFDAHLAYLGAYSGDDRLTSTLALYRAGDADARAVREASRRRLRVPALAIAGRHGRGAAVADALARSIVGVHAIIAPDAGHYPAEQSPDRVNSALIPFLRAA